MFIALKCLSSSSFHVFMRYVLDKKSKCAIIAHVIKYRENCFSLQIAIPTLRHRLGLFRVHQEIHVGMKACNIKDARKNAKVTILSSLIINLKRISTTEKLSLEANTSRGIYAVNSNYCLLYP